MREPLSGKTDWVEYTGTSVVKAVMGGQANLVELGVRGSSGRIAGVSLRLYQPATGQWTLHFANLANGLMTDPMQGSFKNGQGSFYGKDTVDGRAVLVRFLISCRWAPASGASSRLIRRMAGGVGRPTGSPSIPAARHSVISRTGRTTARRPA
ncbi:hypothetical protein NX786_15275 [Telluria mixta]|uniref:Uncharacterized protein n=1 Tax=Telluria mixta TaxID=34071 RepID=A0ABT2BZY1_9BURK|nr:hypothetical protein [Telluria mixta]MCS0630698.1 hypothetical protein [Telluria mixta]WEM98703.1 hypothetical protein P0M04_13650 [Telluria mixta]